MILLRTPVFLLGARLVAYGEKILNDNFDGAKGFAIDGGIKDAT